MSLLDLGGLGPRGPWLALVEATFATGPPQVYAVPLAIGPHPAGGFIGWLPDRERALADAAGDPAFGRALLRRTARSARVETLRGVLRFVRTEAFPAALALRAPTPRPLGAEQTHTSVVFDEVLVLKTFRRIEPGPHPEAEVTGFLTRQGRFPHIPPLAGWVEYRGPGGFRATLAVLQRFVPHESDGWTHVLTHLRGVLGAVGGRAAPGDPGRPGSPRVLAADLLRDVRRLGALTGELHVALAAGADEPAFAPEPVTPHDVAGWAAAVHRQVDAALGALAARRARGGPGLAAALRALQTRRRVVAARTAALAVLARSRCARIRVHGDYHLGQVLHTGPGSFVIADFEGEPARPLAERRAKQCALRDVAGMARSLDYAVEAVLAEWAGQAEALARLAPWAAAWRTLARAALLAGYRGAAAAAPVRLHPAAPQAFRRVLAVFELEKAAYEVCYELAHRPAWVWIPLRGLARLLEAPAP